MTEEIITRLCIMAWVSVDDSVKGPKLRGLSKELGLTCEETLGILVTFWMWGLNNADRYGVLKDVDETDVLDAFSMKFVKKFPNIVETLIDSGWIDYNDNDELTIHDWEQWQKLWYKALDKKEGDIKRQQKRKIELEPEPELEAKSDATGEGQVSFLPDENSDDSKKAAPYSANFEEFWEAYPRRVEKGNAYKMYKARVKEGFSEEDLLKAAKAYDEECRRKHTETTYIKHPKTFLSNTLPFVEYIQKARNAPPGEQQPDESNPFMDAE